VSSPDQVWLGTFSLRHLDLYTRWKVASEAGFDGISVSWAELETLRENGASIKSLRLGADDLGLQLTQLEYVPLMAFRPPAELAEVYERMAIVANELGCTEITSVGKLEDGFTTPTPTGEPLPQVLVDTFGLLCDVCASAGLDATVEFMPYETAIGTLEHAVELLAAVGRDNAKLILDTIHFFRAGADWERLSRLDIGCVGTVQVNDGPRNRPSDSYVTESLTLRRCPGEGDFDLTRFLRCVAAYARPVTTEVMSSELNALPPAAAAQRMIRTTRDALRLAERSTFH
jgi:sugar phosphate isomerase/epimerase